MFKKIVAFPLICVATYLAITAIRTHSASPAAQVAPQEVLIPVSPVSDGTVAFNNLAADGTLTGPGLTIPVRATLNFYDLGADQTLTWFVEVSSAVADPDGTYPVVWVRSYDDQGFTVPMGQTATPNFGEDVVVQPGVYYVRCGVKELRGGADFSICEGTFLATVTP
jgi:hypothetical protein